MLGRMTDRRELVGAQGILQDFFQAGLKSFFVFEAGLDAWMASHPSRKMSGARAKAATGSAHDFPQIALTTNPDRAIQAR